MIPAPYRVLAYALLALACAAFGYVQGVSRESDRRDALALEQTRAAAAAADKESARREALGSEREVSREKIRVVYRTIKEVANVYIDAHKSPPAPLLQRGESGAEGDFWGARRDGDFIGCGLDAGGLRIWNAANGGDAAPLSGEPDYTLPASAPSQIGKVGGLALKPRRGDGAVRAVPGPDGEAGGMRGDEWTLN